MENETKKKPNLIAVGIIIAIVVAAVIGIVILNSGKINAEDIISVSISGVDGKGRATASLDYSIINSKMKQDSDNELKALKAQMGFEDSVNITVEPSEGLKNGDEIMITLSCDKSAAGQLGIKLGKMKFTKTVSDLPDATPIDPFDGLSVSFDGVSPYGNVKIDKNGCNDFTKNNVNFICDAQNVKNGDKIKITAQYSENTADAAMVYVTKTEEEYEVLGLSEYISSLDNVDMSDIEQAISDSVLATVSKARSTGIIFGMGFLADATFTVTSNCKLQDLKSAERYMFIKKPNSYESVVNALYTVYEISINEENGNSQKMYINIPVSNIIKQDDGSLTYDVSSPQGYESLEAVHNRLNSIKDNYTSQQLTTDGIIIPQI